MKRAFSTTAYMIFASLILSSCQAKHPLPSQIEESGFDSVRVAVVQFPIEANQSVEAFSQKIENFVEEAARSQSDLIIFPEYVSLDLWRLGSGLSEREMTEEIAAAFSHFYLELLTRLASEYNLWIIGGSYPRSFEGVLYNSSPIVSPEGRVVLQDKIFLTPWEQEIGFSKGDKVQLVGGPWGIGVVLICYDVEFPKLSQRLGPYTEQLNVIFVPSMTESPEGLQRVLKTSAARAIEHHSFVVVSATVGTPSPQWRHYGESSVFTPETPGHPGRLMKANSGAPGLSFAELDLALLRQTKESAGIYPVRDQFRFPVRALRMETTH